VKLLSDKPWKRFEREIASQFNTKRKLAKGTSTKDDIEHDVFCVDCKAQKKWSIARWFRDLRAAASEENKIPLLICREPKKRLKLVVCELHVFISLCKGAGWLSDVDEEATGGSQSDADKAAGIIHRQR